MGASSCVVDGGNETTEDSMQRIGMWQVRYIVAWYRMLGGGCGTNVAMERSGLWKV